MLTARQELKRRIEPLRRVPFLEECTDRQLARIDQLGTTIRVAAGRALTHEDELGRECFVTIEGVAAVCRQGVRIAEIGPGSIAGEMALLDQTQRNATVVTETAMSLLVFSAREFSELRKLTPGIEPLLRQLADERRAVSAPAA